VVVIRKSKGDNEDIGYDVKGFSNPGRRFSSGSAFNYLKGPNSARVGSNQVRVLLRKKIVKPKSKAKPSLCARCGEGFASRVLLFKHLEINPDHESENQIIDNADDDDGADICGAGVKPSCAFRLSPWLQELPPASAVLRVRRAKKGLGGGGSSAGNLVLLAKAKYLSAGTVDVFDNEAAARPRARKGKGAGATISAKAAAAAALAPDPGDGKAAADGAAAGDGGGGLDVGVSAAQAAADQAAAAARAAAAPPVASLEAGCAVQVDPPPRALSFSGLGGGGAGAAVAAAMGSAFPGSPAPIAAAAAGVSTPYKALGLLGRDLWIPAKPPSGFALSLDTVWPTFANASPPPPSGRTFGAPTKGVSKVSKGGKANKAWPAKQAAAVRSSSSSSACACCAPPPDLCDSGGGVCVELAFPSPRSQGTAAGTGFTMYAKGDGFVQAVALPAALLNGGQLVRAEVELAVEANFSGAPLRLGCIVNGVEVGEVTVAAPKGNARTAVRKRG
jgi:hypothetical protein